MLRACTVRLICCLYLATSVSSCLSMLQVRKARAVQRSDGKARGAAKHGKGGRKDGGWGRGGTGSGGGEGSGIGAGTEGEGGANKNAKGTAASQGLRGSEGILAKEDSDVTEGIPAIESTQGAKGPPAKKPPSSAGGTPAKKGTENAEASPKEPDPERQETKRVKVSSKAGFKATSNEESDADEKQRKGKQKTHSPVVLYGLDNKEEPPKNCRSNGTVEAWTIGKKVPPADALKAAARELDCNAITKITHLRTVKVRAKVKAKAKGRGKGRGKGKGMVPVHYYGAVILCCPDRE